MDKEEQARAEKSAESRRIADEKAKKKAEQDLRDNAIVSLRPVDSDNKQKAVQKDQKPQAAAQPAAQSTKDKQSAEQKKIEADQKQKELLLEGEIMKAIAIQKEKEKEARQKVNLDKSLNSKNDTSKDEIKVTAIVNEIKNTSKEESAIKNTTV